MTEVLRQVTAFILIALWTIALFTPEPVCEREGEPEAPTGFEPLRYKEL